MDEPIRRTVETYERVAEEYVERHADRSVVADQVRAFLDHLDGRRVLDAGCGPGWETATFADAGCEAIGLDLTPAFLAEATTAAPEAAFVRGDLRSLPFRDDRFDGVWACASLLHLQRSGAVDALAEFDRVLADGGVVSASLQRVGGVSEEASPYAGDERYFERYEPAELRTLFERAGFGVLDCEADEQWIVVRARA